MIRSIVECRNGARQTLRAWVHAVAAFSSHPFSAAACVVTTSADALEHRHPYNGRFFPWSAPHDIAFASSDLGDNNLGPSQQTTNAEFFFSICPKRLVVRDLLETGNQIRDFCRLCGSNYDKLEKNNDSRCRSNILDRVHKTENAVNLPAFLCGEYMRHLERRNLVQIHVDVSEHVKLYAPKGVCETRIMLPEMQRGSCPLEASSVKRKRKKKMNKHKQRKLRRRDRHRK